VGSEERTKVIKNAEKESQPSYIRGNKTLHMSVWKGKRQKGTGDEGFSNRKGDMGEGQGAFTKGGITAGGITALGIAG